MPIKQTLIIVFTALILISISAFETERLKANKTFDAFSKIKVDGGYISGTINSGGDVHVFKGIPFASPPVGDLRLKAPQPVQPWTGLRKCEAFSPSPMQETPEPFYMWSEEFLIPKEPISEDCLYLNVWTGAKSAKEKRPVLVCIYGGGFTSGGTAVPVYDGEALAKKGIVTVSINYRVGIFCFFAHPELTKESGHNASGNYGLMDQIATLRWVKKNIAAFGGNPENVVIAGQSAGSVAVVFLVASPLAKDLFNKAIAESGAGLLSRSAGPQKFALRTLQQAEQEGKRVTTELKVASIAELRNIPAKELLEKAKFPSQPITDGYVLPESVPAIFKQNKENNVALVTGWNEEEGLMFSPLKKASEFQQDIVKQYGSYVAKLLQHYPAFSDSVAAISQQRLARDLVFGAQNYTLANIMSSQGKKVYVYRFTRKVPGTGEYAKFGAFHTGEVPYVFNNIKFITHPWRPWGTLDYQLANTMSSYWVNFITSANPNGSGLPNWPRYETDSKKIMDLGDHSNEKVLSDTASLNFIYDMMRVDQ